MKKIALIALSGLLATSLAHAGAGGYLNIKNDTSYNVVKTYESGPAMNTWVFPQNFAPATSAHVYLEFGKDFVNPLDNVVTYAIECSTKYRDIVTISASNDKLAPNKITVEQVGQNCAKVVPVGDIMFKENGESSLTFLPAKN